MLSDAAAYASDVSTQRMEWEIMREEEGDKDKLDEEIVEKHIHFSTVSCLLTSDVFALDFLQINHFTCECFSLKE